MTKALYVCKKCKKTFSTIDQKVNHKCKYLMEAVTEFCGECSDYLPIEERVILFLGLYFCTKICVERFTKIWEKGFYYQIGRLPKAVNS